jgi:hypothetical protein
LETLIIKRREWININKILVGKIEEYISLLEDSYDERAKSNFIPIFKSKIDRIKSRNYKDKRTRINLNIGGKDYERFG